MNKENKTNIITQVNVRGIAFVLCISCIPMVQATETQVFHDGFDDGNRTANPSWYLIKKESSTAITEDTLIGHGNALKFDNEHSGKNPTTSPYAQKGIVAHLGTTLSLAANESLVLSFDFRLQKVIEQTGLFRFGFSHDSGTPFSADGKTNGSSPGDNDYSYFVGMSSGSGSGIVTIREDNGTGKGYMAGDDLTDDKGSGTFSLNDTKKHHVVFTVLKTPSGTREFKVEVDGALAATGYDSYNVKNDFNGVGFVSNHRDLDFIIDNVKIVHTKPSISPATTP